MGSLSILNVDLLLQPISESSPTGDDVRTSQPDLYYKIKDARTSARTIERQDQENKEKANKFWDSVYDDSLTVLSKYSKDLEVSAWLIEVLVRKYGLAGFRDGFSLVNAILTNFWDTFYPLQNPENPEERFFAFAGLNGEEKDGALIVPLYGIQITQGKTLGPFALWNYVQAVDVEKIPDPQKRENKVSQGAITFSNLETAAKETQKNFFLTFKDDLQDALKEFGNFTSFLDVKCGENAPPTSRIQATLETAEEALNFLAKNILIQSPESQDSQPQASSLSQDASQQSTNDLTSRDIAFSKLLEVARFFKNTEPQSPLPYILERAVRWGQLSLPDLLSELIDDESTKNKLFQLTGMENNT